MKKLIGLVFIIFIAACKKDRSELTDFNNRLLGTWLLQSNDIEYYDDNGKVVYKTKLQANNAAEKIIFMEGLRAKVLTKDSQVLNTAYDAGIENEVLYVGFSAANIFEANVWRVTSHSAVEMTWKVVYTEIQYENEQGLLVQAPKAELTLKLKK